MLTYDQYIVHVVLHRLRYFIRGGIKTASFMTKMNQVRDGIPTNLRDAIRSSQHNQNEIYTYWE